MCDNLLVAIIYKQTKEERMNFKNLKERHGQLIQFLESNNYCTDYIKWFQYEINWILEESAHRDYQSYEEIFYDRISRRAYSKSTVDMKKTIIGTIKRFDLERSEERRVGKEC